MAFKDENDNVYHRQKEKRAKREGAAKENNIKMPF